MIELTSVGRQKIALNAMFALGLLVVGAGIARTYYLYWLGVKYDMYAYQRAQPSPLSETIADNSTFLI